MDSIGTVATTLPSGSGVGGGYCGDEQRERDVVHAGGEVGGDLDDGLTGEAGLVEVLQVVLPEPRQVEVAGPGERSSVGVSSRMLETRYVRIRRSSVAATTYQLPFFSTRPYGSSIRSTSRGAYQRR